jgi:hypothetical protein
MFIIKFKIHNLYLKTQRPTYSDQGYAGLYVGRIMV